MKGFHSVIVLLLVLLFSVVAHAQTALFSDNFTRSNTAPGNLGTPTGYSAYTMYGPEVSGFPLPAATNGYINNNVYVEDQNNVTYAMQDVGAIPNIIQWRVSWLPAGGATGEATAAVLVCNAASGFISNCLHIQVSRGDQNIQTLVNGVFTTFATMTPSIAADGSIYTVTLTIAGRQVILRIEGGSTHLDQQISAVDASFLSVVGTTVYFENFMMDAIDAVSYHAVSITGGGVVFCCR